MTNYSFGYLIIVSGSQKRVNATSVPLILYGIGQFTIGVLWPSFQVTIPSSERTHTIPWVIGLRSLIKKSKPAPLFSV